MRVREHGDYQIKKRSFRRMTLGGTEYEVYYKFQEVAHFDTLREAREYIQQQGEQL